MNSDRLSLSSSALAGRVKKYDTYVHRQSRSARQMDFKPHTGQQARPPIIRKQPISNAMTPNSQHVEKFPQSLLVKKLNPKVTSRKSGASSIALQSVALSKETTDENGVIQRQFSDENVVNYTPVKSKTSKLQKSLYVLGVFVFVFSAFTSVQTLFTNKQAQDQIATLGVRTDEQGVSEGTGNEPSESEVSNAAIAAYQVRNPEDPRYLRVPALGIFARIKNLGIDSSGAVDAPWNINDAGWYNGSARPGNAIGSSLILGHVSGWTASGVFKNLKNLKTGTQFEIEKGSGEKVRYEVTRSENIPLDQVNMANILSSEEPNTHDLKLMTCSGKYNRVTETFEDRFIVYAKHIK